MSVFSKIVTVNILNYFGDPSIISNVKLDYYKEFKYYIELKRDRLVLKEKGKLHNKFIREYAFDKCMFFVLRAPTPKQNTICYVEKVHVPWLLEVIEGENEALFTIYNNEGRNTLFDHLKKYNIVNRLDKYKEYMSQFRNDYLE